MRESPVVRFFAIRGLHGYKDVEIDFESSTRVIIAENGSGKTTVLGALASFLKGNLHDLIKLKFQSIECRLDGLPEAVIIKHEQIAASGPVPSQILEWAQLSGLSVSELRNRIVVDPDPGHPLGGDFFHSIYSKVPQDRSTFNQQLSEVRQALRRQEGSLASGQMEAVRNITKNYQILYLPTYRRVELPKVRDRKAHAIERARYGYVRSASEKADQDSSDSIQFGLADVEDRLDALMAEIQRQSNIGYRRITATIIDDALSGAISSGSLFASNLPAIEDLALFFSRIEETFSTKKRLEQIGELYSKGTINSTDNVLLRYFLGKISEVMGRTKEMESRVEAFVEKANTYLKQSADEKELNYSANTMKVAVRDRWTDSNVDFDSLSSGEKQVISLMAHMYLGIRDKIVLIDEPELSLSIDWQRRILPDIVTSPTCAQLLAITHSPFIFENELDPYAAPLRVTKSLGQKIQ